MQCDKCNSDNTQRLEIVYEGGTSEINTKSNTTGLGFGGVLGVGGARTTTSGTSQTALGMKATPPMKKSYKWAVISVAVGAAFASTGMADKLTFGVPLIAAGAYFIYAAFTYNKDKWPPLYKYWQECWLCHKCGNIYHHP